MDQDGAAGPHGGGDGLDRLGHAGERAGIRQPGDGGAEEASRASASVAWPRCTSSAASAAGCRAPRRGASTTAGSGGGATTHRSTGAGKTLTSGRVPSDAGFMPTPPPSAGYRIAPHPSQPSRMAPLRIWLRRLSGMEVWQAPQVPPTSGTTTSRARERRSRS